MKRLSVLLLAALLLILLPGCQCGSEILPSPPGPVAGDGILSIYGVDPITLDPAVSAEMTSHQYVMHIFGGLVRLDDNLEPAPEIARSWSVSEDGRTYTFEIDPAAKFHDGRPVTAADVKYSWERACNPATGSRVAATYLGDIVGAKDVVAGRASEISGVSVVDEATLRVTIEAPRAYFLYKLSYPTAFVVDHDNVGKGQWWRLPNGTGPFRLVEWVDGDYLVLNKNPLYHGEAPKLDAVIFQLLSGVPMRMYETGEIDVTGVSVAYIDLVTDETGPFLDQLMVTPELSFSYIGFNAAAPPFDDPAVRRAFALSIDKDKLVELVFRDLVEAADGILPPGIPGYNEDLAGLGFDPAAARELIKNSSYGSVENLPPVALTTSGYGGVISSSLEAIIQEWRANLGVEVSVRVLEPEFFLYNLREEKDQLFDMGWVADYPHPQNFLEVLFRGDEENNFGEYANPAVDALLEEAAMETDAEASLELYRQAEQLLVDDAACVPLWFGRNYMLVKPYVDGYEMSPMGFPNLSNVSVNRD